MNRIPNKNDGIETPVNEKNINKCVKNEFGLIPVYTPVGIPIINDNNAAIILSSIVAGA